MAVDPVLAIKVIASLLVAVSAWYANKRIDRDLLKRFKIDSFVRITVFLCVYFAAIAGIGLIVLDTALSTSIQSDWMTTLSSLIDGVFTLIQVIMVIIVVKIAADLSSRFIDTSRTGMTTRFKLKNIQIDLFDEFIRLLVYAVGVLVILNLFHLEGIATTLIASAGVIGIVVAFATQNMLQSFLAGFAISMDRTFEVGDSVRIGDIDGVIEKIKARTTRVKTPDGYLVIIPNSRVSDSVVMNYSKRPHRRISISLKVDRTNQKKALALCKDDETRAELEKNLQTYQAKAQSK